MFLALFLWLGLFLFAVLDCLAADPTRCRGLPKLLWIPVIGLLPIVGPSAWLMFGRPHRLPENGRPPRPPRRPLGPEDDPRFLEKLGGRASNVQTRPDPETPPVPETPKQAAAPEQPASPRHDAKPAKADHGVNDLSRWEEDLARREEELRRKLGNLPPDQH